MIHIRIHQNNKSIALEPRIPLYVAAGAARTAAVAGEFGDGLISGDFFLPETISTTLQHALAGARASGRSRESLPYIMEGPVCVLHSGETLQSRRVLEITQPFVMLVYKWFATIQVPAEFLPEVFRPSYQDYLDHIEAKRIPPEERHLRVCEDIFAYVPEEGRFVAPEVIRAATLTGSLDEVVDRISALERAGLTQLVVWPRNWRWQSDDYLADVRQVIARSA
jgi:alkanesulfonate monooxygenase SsuD/methylene tetrahydromethanopterin reductase-like flavin-dependent oxidoreductase (luciferase family)